MQITTCDDENCQWRHYEPLPLKHSAPIDSSSSAQVVIYFFITVPTTCSRPSSKMVAFINIFIFTVISHLTTLLQIKDPNFACTLVLTV